MTEYVAHRLDAAANRVAHVQQYPLLGTHLTALADSLAEVIAYLRDEAPAPYAPVHPMPTRIVPEPRVLPGETLGDYWKRTGATAEWPAKNVVPLTADEEASS